MYYGDGDCDLEEDLLVDVEEMKEGFVDGQGINLIVLFDRHPAYSSDKSVFGEDFTDTRLYRITANTVWRLNGGSEFPEISKNGSYEANMGSGETLKKYQY
jgi:clostripain